MHISSFHFAAMAQFEVQLCFVCTLAHHIGAQFKYFIWQLARMPVSAPQRAKRILVQLLQTLAQQYNLVLRLTLDASDAQVLGCFQKGLPQGSPRHG